MPFFYYFLKSNNLPFQQLPANIKVCGVLFDYLILCRLNEYITNLALIYTILKLGWLKSTY